MHDPIDEFGEKVLEKRKARDQTQRELAIKLGMSYRTVLQAETGQSIPRFDTVIILAQDLGISLDALVFPETAAPNAVPKCVYDFFHGMSANDAQRYIDFCKRIEALTEEKEKKENK